MEVIHQPTVTRIQIRSIVISVLLSVCTIIAYNYLKEIVYKEQIIQSTNPNQITGLRLLVSPIYQSTREKKSVADCATLRFKERTAVVPLRNISVETWIHTFAADVTLTQVFVNEEQNPIEAIYVFPIEENAAIYAFTAEIGDRLITAVLKEKNTAKSEYAEAVRQGQTAVLLEQSERTLDTFVINIGVLPPSKECIVKIRYVTELDLIDENSIRFVVPTTVAPRYNPDLGSLQSPDEINTEYGQKTPYLISFLTHINRGNEYKIMQVANLSHPVNVSVSDSMMDISTEGVALDRDFILDIDLPENRASVLVAVEQDEDSTKYAILTAWTPHPSHFPGVLDENMGKTTTKEFIFIVDCSGSMHDNNKINLAREAMLLFVRSLPLGSHFNIIRFGSFYNILFDSKTMTAVYDEQTAKQAELLSHSMEADLGGTELLMPLQYLKDHPPVKGRSREVFILTDGEVSNTDEVINLCRSMSSTTRIFSLGLGHSPSRSLVKGLARATNGYFVFVPPNSKVDIFVVNQLRRALIPSFANARLEWHGLPSNSIQTPETIPSVFLKDRILVYTLLENIDLNQQSVDVDFFLGGDKIGSIKLTNDIVNKGNTVRRLAGKALIQELQHTEYSVPLDQRIIDLSLTHQILSTCTAFIGIETTISDKNDVPSQVRYIPIQISKGDEHLFHSATSFSFYMAGTLGNWTSYNLMVLAISSGTTQLLRLTEITPLNAYTNNSSSVTVTAPATESLSTFTDSVRCLIERQLFDGMWRLNDDEIRKLTNGKSWNVFKSAISEDEDIIVTAIVIAVLESQYSDQQDLWFMVVEKARKRMLEFGLSKDNVDLLVDEIKNKLQLNIFSSTNTIPIH